jgi:uncharacterized membrane protein
MVTLGLKGLNPADNYFRTHTETTLTTNMYVIWFSLSTVVVYFMTLSIMDDIASNGRITDE